MTKIILLLTILGTGMLMAAELPEVRVPLRKGEIKIDGTGGDAGWKDAAVIQLDKAPLGIQKNEQGEIQVTEIRLTYDERFLFVSFHCTDSEVISAGTKHDDPLHTGDAVEIFIDGIGDLRQFYEIQINAEALVRDVNYLFTGTDPKTDRNGLYVDKKNAWDDPCFNLTGLLVAAKLTPEGYYVECAIPAKELLRRRTRDILMTGDRLRANFVRLDSRKNGTYTMSHWSPTLPGRPHRTPGRMGFLILD